MRELIQHSFGLDNFQHFINIQRSSDISKAIKLSQNHLYKL